jgi:hypothetical protein
MESEELFMRMVIATKGISKIICLMVRVLNKIKMAKSILANLSIIRDMVMEN